MDALTYTLAFSRMAPIQCATWGHPVTTGSPTMDYFVSSELLEVTHADTHYTEKLIRLPSLGTYYYRPRITEAIKSRRDLGLSDNRNLYVCPQTLFKFHPEFDEILAQILRRDPRGELVLIEGRTANWTRLLRDRFARVMPDVAERVRWLPVLANQDFLQLLKVADAVLDPPHFGGGNSSYEALAVGAPVVTLPGEYLRSRITRALYAKMEITDLIADSHEQYVALALRLATDADFRTGIAHGISNHSQRLFEDVCEIGDLANALALVG
jgi:predicted O-linked N-acetylglucosamine transferase (SPINDLY family)